ncbi:MAG: hypothetical protein IJZ35_08290 [Clostridia bacterium]|nr:hypothetical protein [Clostridia bacterium]
MNKKKNLSVILLVFAVTAVVIFVPLGINAFNSDSLINKTDYWEYDTSNANTVTSQQVAELYYANQLIGGTYSNISSDGDNSEFENVKNDVNSLIKSVLQNGEFRFTEGGIYGCTKQSILAVANSSPVALNLVNFSYRHNGGYLEIVYEEKTLTLISFSCESTDLSADDIANITNQLANYYKNLGLNESQYFCNSDTNISCFILSSSETEAA